MNHDFLVSEEIQGTLVDALNPFSSKSITLTTRGNLWNFSTNLALCPAIQIGELIKKNQMCQNQRPWFISQKLQLPLGLPIRLYQFLKPWVQALIWLHLIWPKKHVTMDFWHCQSCFNSASSRIKVALILVHFEKRKKI